MSLVIAGSNEEYHISISQEEMSITDSPDTSWHPHNDIKPQSQPGICQILNIHQICLICVTPAPAMDPPR